MAINKTLAVVLRRRDFKESSLLVTFYTKDFGKINGIVKGIKRPKSKYASSLEPFSLNEIIFYTRRTGDLRTVSSADLMESYPNIRKDLQKLGFAVYFSELIELVSVPHDANRELFDALIGCLALLEHDQEPEKAACIFEIKLLSTSGIMPGLECCVYCGSKIVGEARFSNHLGGLLCQNCLTQDFNAQAILKGTIATIDYIEKSSLQQCLNLKLTKAIREELSIILRKFLDYHLERVPKSLAFLEKVK